MDERTLNAFQSLSANANAWAVVWKYLLDKDKALGAELVMSDDVNSVIRAQGAARYFRDLLVEIDLAVKGKVTTGRAVKPDLL